MRSITRLGLATLLLAGLTAAADAATQAPADSPEASFRRCASVGRGYASTAPCALQVRPGEVQRLQIRIERNLPAAPAALVLLWQERANEAAMMYRIEGSAFANAPIARGSVFSVPVPDSYCRSNARNIDVELELADGRNLGPIGRFSFPCPR